MSAEIKNKVEVTDASWRPKFYGLVKEGRKFRVSSAFLRHLAWVVAIGIAAVQVYSAFIPSFKKGTERLFAPPQVRADMQSVYVPGLMDAKRDAEIERKRKAEVASSKPVPIIEKIRPVSLSTTSGIPPGAEVLAQLASGGANGMVKARTLEVLMTDGELILPKGTVLLGKGSSSDDRLYISFRRAILPDRTEMKIKALAYDEKDRIIGLKGQKISDYAFKLAASSGLIFLGGVADGMREDYSSNPFAQRRPTMRDAALNGISTATSDLSHEMLDSMKNSQERVVVDHSTRLIVIFGDTDDSK